MARGSVNKVILVGRLGKDPESRYTKADKQVVSFSLATTSSFKDESGSWQDKTEWHNIVLWDQPAKFVSEYVKKGNRVYVEGRLQTRPWQDKDGNKRYTTEVVGHTVESLETQTEAPVKTPAPKQEPEIEFDDVPF